MARQKGTLRLGSNLEPQMNAPLDAREVVALKADLTDTDSFPYFYVGMTVFVKEEKKKYTLIGDDPTDIDNWQVDAASSSGGGDATFSSGLTVGEAVGGLKVGDTYAAGDDIEDLLRAMLDPLKYPTFESPVVILNIVNADNMVVRDGDSKTVKLGAYLNRGKITPAYGTSGYRSGEADQSTWKLNGADPTEYTTDNRPRWEVNVVQANAGDSYFNALATVTVTAGEQPKDSHGGDYDVAYPGGNLNSNTLVWHFVEPTYSNTANITVIAEDALVKDSVKERVFAFPACTVANPEVFDIPVALSVSKIEVLNDLSGKYEDCFAEFTATPVGHTYVTGGTEHQYIRFTDNRGYAAGPRTIKVTLQ